MNINPDILQTFVDDSKNVVRELPLGAELNLQEKKITINREKVQSDKNIPVD